MVELSKAYIVVKSLRPFVSHESLRMIYYSYFHALLSYGIKFSAGIHLIVTMYLNYKEGP
jgi:hypothetical protein